MAANEFPCSSPVFRHGVASGDPTPDRVVIWTRVTANEDRTVAVRWQVATDADFQHVVTSNDIRTSAADDFTVKVDVARLEPDTRYYYRFEALGQFSSVGRTKTLPRAGNHRVRFAQVACAKLNAGFFNAYGRIADRNDLDFVLHLGDYIYEVAETSPPGQMPPTYVGREFDPRAECKTLDDYRRRYAQYHLDPDLQRLHQALPLIATIDDHETADGAWRDGAAAHEPERDGAWANRRGDALRARWEWLPLRMPNPSDAQQLYQRVNIGDLIDLFVLDTRTHRDRPLGGSATQDPDRTALGAQQRDWLVRQLDSSEAQWRLICSPTMMTPIWSKSLSPECKAALRTLKLIDVHGEGPDCDPWAGYPCERDLILRHIRDRGLCNVVVLSGDVHVSLACELHCDNSDGTETPIAVEFVSPSVTSQNLDDKMNWTPRTASLPIEHALKETLSHLRWCDLDSHGYVVVDVNRERVLAEWWLVDAINSSSVGELCGAAWKFDAGQRRLIAVHS